MWSYGPWFNNGVLSGGNFWLIGLVIIAGKLIFWGLLIWLGVSLFRRMDRKHSHNNFGKNDALDILRERYARGEIDTEEFQRRREELLR